LNIISAYRRLFRRFKVDASRPFRMISAELLALFGPIKKILRKRVDMQTTVHKRKPPNEQALVAKKPRKISAIGSGTIPLGANNSSLIFQLLCGEVEKTENFKVPFGKMDKHEVVGIHYFYGLYSSVCVQNTSGESKISVYKRIGSARYVCYRSENGKYVQSIYGYFPLTDIFF